MGISRRQWIAVLGTVSLAGCSSEEVSPKEQLESNSLLIDNETEHTVNVHVSIFELDSEDYIIRDEVLVIGPDSEIANLSKYTQPNKDYRITIRPGQTEKYTIKLTAGIRALVTITENDSITAYMEPRGKQILPPKWEIPVTF